MEVNKQNLSICNMKTEKCQTTHLHFFTMLEKGISVTLWLSGFKLKILFTCVIIKFPIYKLTVAIKLVGKHKISAIMWL